MENKDKSKLVEEYQRKKHYATLIPVVFLILLIAIVMVKQGPPLFFVHSVFVDDTYSVTERIDDFEISIYSAKEVYAKNERIDMWFEFTYVGKEDEKTIQDGYTFLYYKLHHLEKDVVTDDFSIPDVGGYSTFRQRETQIIDLQKNRIFFDEDQDVFLSDYNDGPDLYLQPGTYEVTAVFHFDDYDLLDVASLTIQVLDMEVVLEEETDTTEMNREELENMFPRNIPLFVPTRPVTKVYTTPPKDAYSTADFFEVDYFRFEDGFIQSSEGKVYYVDIKGLYALYISPILRAEENYIEAAKQSIQRYPISKRNPVIPFPVELGKRWGDDWRYYEITATDLTYSTPSKEYTNVVEVTETFADGEIYYKYWYDQEDGLLLHTYYNQNSDYDKERIIAELYEVRDLE